jgi:glycosyltransferase involved in cell wall biosynthesis
MIELVRRLDSRRWAVHVVCIHAEGAWFSRAAEAALSVASFPIRSFTHPATLRRIGACAQWLKQRRIAALHSFDLYSNIFFLPAAAAAGVPVRIGSRREINAGKSAGQIALQRAAYGCAHRIVANADAVRARLRREGVQARRIAVVPNGLDLDSLASRTTMRAPRRLVIVANLRPGKGHDALIDAMPLVLQRFPDAQLAIIGEGTERAQLEIRARERGIAAAVTFEGHCDNVPARLADADLFVLPSESEAFPNAVLEAMAAGLPVIASSVGGIVEVVTDGSTGLLVPPRDPGALADRVCRLMSDPALAHTLAARGRALVEARYGFDRMVSSIEQIYDDELARRAPALVMQSQLAPL